MHYRVKNGLIDQIAFYPIIFSSMNIIISMFYFSAKRNHISFLRSN
jgi:hypothetical protein